MPGSKIEPDDRTTTRRAPGARGAHLPVAIEDGLAVLGFVVGIAMVSAGIAWIIPQLGLVGLVWTAVAVGIMAANVRRLFRR